MPPSSRHEFIRLLNDTRVSRHLSIRSAARLADVPTPTMQGWLSGDHFPTPALRPNFLTLVRALDLEPSLPADLWSDQSDWTPPRSRKADAPYLGLRPFGAGDRDLFHGRHTEASRLAEAVLNLAETEGHGIVALVGASGSGKSSLLAAGILAGECVDGRLAGWTTILLGGEALSEPSDALDLAEVRLVLIDQLEDALRLPSVAQRAALDRLAAIAAERIVVVAIRADAYAASIAAPELTAALARPVLLAPLSRAELHEVIVAPAALAGVAVDADLAQVLENELAPGSAPAIPNNVLPLLSTALLATWVQGRGRRMSVADYVGAGGVARAIDSLAAQTLAGIDEADRPVAVGLFLRLVRVTDDIVARESVPLADLSDRDLRIVRPFVDARLLTLADDSVRISHDALLDHWAQLHTWIDERRAHLITHQKLRTATALWIEAGREPTSLLPVERLGITSDWLVDRGQQDLLTEAEQSYLAASREHFAGVLAQERRTSARLRRRGRFAIAFAALTTALAVVVSVLLAQARGLQAAADHARHDAESRQVAIVANTLRAKDSNLRAQMALAAVDLSDTRESRSALLDAAAFDVPVRWLGKPSSVVAVNGAQDLVARVDGVGQVTLWRGDELTRSAGATHPLGPWESPLWAAALTRVAGRDLLAAGGGGVAGIWDVTGAPKLLTDLPGDEVTTYATAFSANGRFAAFGTSLGEVVIHRVDPTAGGSEIARLQINPPAAIDDGSTAAVSSLAFDAAGTLWVGGRPDAIDRWRIGDSIDELPAVEFRHGDAPLRALTVAIDPSGTQLAAGTTANTVLRWQVGSEIQPLTPLEDFGSWINALAYSPDGSRLLVGSSDQTAQLFDLTGERLRSMTGPALVTGVGFAADHLLTASSDGALRVWPQRTPLIRSGGGAVYNLATDATGSRWLATGTLTDGVGLWRLDGQPRQVALEYPALEGARSAAVAIAPDGSFLVAASKTGEVVYWPLTDAGPGAPVVIDSGIGYISCVTISPDSGLVAAMGYSGQRAAILQASADGLTKLSEVEAVNAQMGTFSADSQTLVIAIASNRVILWRDLRAATPTKVAEIGGFETAPIAVAAAPRSARFVVGEDSGRVSAWSFEDAANPALVTEWTDAHSAAYAVTYSPDEQTVAAATGDDVIWGWDTTAAEPTARFALDGDLERPWDIRFLHDGTTLVAGGNNGGVRLWPAAIDAAHDDLCTRRGDPLTTAEWQRYLPGIEPEDPCR